MARKMKDSGIEWIGEIPEGWEVTKLKYLSTFPIEKNAHTDSPYIGLENIESWTGKYVSSDSQYDKSQALAFFENNILFGKLRPYLAKVFCTSNDGCCSSEFCILKFSSSVNIRYFWNLLISPTFIDHVTKSTYGTKMPRANTDFIKNICVPVPPRIEQDRIALYLDATSAKIDSLISETRSSIEEYKKLKQSVITQAVTKGVRGEREMKDSGNPWFGQIPTDWKLSRVGLHFSIILGKMLCNAPLNDTYTLEPYYCAADVHFDGVADGERKKMWFSPIEKDLYRVSVGDLLVVEGGAGAGGSAIVENQDSYTYIQNSIMIVRSKGNTDNRYLRYLLEFLVKQGYIDIVCNKATIPHFTKDKLSCVPFCLCPTGEQKEIADYLDAKCAEIDKLIAKKEQLAKELESYKKSLIYEVVTGKREV